MQLVNSTTYSKIICFLAICLFINTATAQNNSPYSRYGIGDLSNSTNVAFRGMGGASIASNNENFVTIANPASYAWLGDYKKLKLKDVGHIVTFDVGAEFNSTTLRQVNPIGKYNSKNLVFNYMQFATQLGKKGDAGFVFGVHPVSRINYKIFNAKRLTNIDSINTVYDGSGGAYKGFVGFGKRIKNLSLGLNTGFVFGKKDITTNIKLINDTVDYYETSHNNKMNFGNVFFQTGATYSIPLKAKDKFYKGVNLAVTYEFANNIKTNTDIERFVYNSENVANPSSNIDSVFVQNNIKAIMKIPQTIGFGFRYYNNGEVKNDDSRFGLNVDFVSTKWSNYRLANQADALQNSWTLKAGVEINPLTNKPKIKIGNETTYRGGFSYGKDYIAAAGNMNVYSFSLGASFPTTVFSPQNKGVVQPNYINTSLEFGKRGNNTINLSENFVKFTLSFTLADRWYIKAKYD